MATEFKFIPGVSAGPLLGQITRAADDVAAVSGLPAVCYVEWSTLTRLTRELGDAPCYSNEDGEEGLVVDTVHGRLRILPRVDFG